MSVIDLNKLQARIEEGKEAWPLKADLGVLQHIEAFAALHETNRPVLKKIHPNWDANRFMIVDPLAPKISGAFADLIFGEDPTFEAADDDDQVHVDEMIEANDLSAELQRACDLSVAEGEVWYRIYVDPTQADRPIIEWHSRATVVPLWRGRKLLGAAFLSEYRKDNETVHRYFNLQATGYSRNLLYKGTADRLGDAVSLDSFEATNGLKRDDWAHGFEEIMCGRVPNVLGRRKKVGVSEYDAVFDLLLALNEAATVAHENMQMSGKKRVAVPERYLDEHGRFPIGTEVIVASDAHTDPDKPGDNLVQIEWAFDAEQMDVYKKALATDTLTRCGITAAWVDGNTAEGMADSGTARRLRMTPTTLASEGKARYWDAENPKVLLKAQLLDGLDAGRGGFGRDYKDNETAPTVTRTDALPEDEVEKTARLSTLRSDRLISQKTAIEMAFPEWDDARVEEELSRLQQEQPGDGQPGGFQPVRLTLGGPNGSEPALTGDAGGEGGRDDAETS